MPLLGRPIRRLSSMPVTAWLWLWLWLWLLSGAAVGQNTILDDQFCQNYYKIETGGDCPSLRDTIRSEVRGNGTPTLELGDPATQPAMLLLHGWPDTAAVWANQFADLCGTDKEYFCVAPSMIDYHPDFPLADDKSSLFYSSQRDAYLAVIRDLGLTDITFVIFDYGAALGYQMLYLYPDLFRKVIAMDIPMVVEKGSARDPFAYVPSQYLGYQQINVQAFLNGLDDLMASHTNIPMVYPCYNCRIAPNATGIGSRTGWPYYAGTREDVPWTSDGFAVPVDDWDFSFAPSFPEEIPILYFWGTDFFQSPSWFEWIDGRNDGSEHVQVVAEGFGHWLNVHAPEVVNAKILEWGNHQFSGDDNAPSRDGSDGGSSSESRESHSDDEEEEQQQQHDPDDEEEEEEEEEDHSSHDHDNNNNNNNTDGYEESSSSAAGCLDRWSIVLAVAIVTVVASRA